ncbi:hypothetical protein RHGRI_007326 [Rhododendron griersonianum]|uniref:Uncharacterized protein n=1 Tax=Rhododendron griersonianum TaxID=479676 RepID=A0AAV6KWF0_9ERIC|nr:hypothetical protein RHGRI_007326 [Rhododendron griersonianum]
MFASHVGIPIKSESIANRHMGGGRRGDIECPANCCISGLASYDNTYFLSFSKAKKILSNKSISKPVSLLQFYRCSENCNGLRTMTLAHQPACLNYSLKCQPPLIFLMLAVDAEVFSLQRLVLLMGDVGATGLGGALVFRVVCRISIWWFFLGQVGSSVVLCSLLGGGRLSGDGGRCRFAWGRVYFLQVSLKKVSGVGFQF